MVSKKNKEGIHPDLVLTKEHIFSYLNWSYLDCELEKQNSEYGAYLIKLDQLIIRFRVAKTTPTKIGQFVTLWKRNKQGIIEPYSNEDKMDLVIISTRVGEQIGQFIFPKELLIKKGILSLNGKGGKRGFRVYPIWDQPDNQQAIKTQKWQLDYFFQFNDSHVIDIKRLKDLYPAKC